MIMAFSHRLWPRFTNILITKFNLKTIDTRIKKSIFTYNIDFNRKKMKTVANLS